MSVWVVRVGGWAMKIYVLFLLISVIVGVSYLPLRRPAKTSAPVPSESISASAPTTSRLI
jgi:hypothetical protein